MVGAKETQSSRTRTNTNRHKGPVGGKDVGKQLVGIEKKIDILTSQKIHYQFISQGLL